MRGEGHFEVDETAVLPDGVAAERGGVWLGVLRDEFEREAVGGLDVDVRIEDAVDKAGLGVVFRVPVVHRVEERLRSLDGDFWAFGDDVELGIGDECGDFDDAVLASVESGHLAVYPDERLMNASRHIVYPLV